MAACGTPAGGPGQVASWLPDGGAAGDAAGGVAPLGVCRPVRASEDLHARIEVVVGTPPSSTAAMGGLEIRTADLFDRFNVVCGRCHVSAGNGGKQTGPATFARDVDQDWLAALESDDPKKTMPPGAPPFSQRPAADASRQLGVYLEAWLSQGRPAETFILEAAASAGPAAPAGARSSGGGIGYVYAAMTNLGDCVPDRGLFANNPSSEMEAKDRFFADATALPTDLGDTDLTSLNSDALALNGVIAYVPTYPLWSDGSGKLRHIRLPRGTHIEFDKEKQTFTIPPNTRFYKTFFRTIVDSSGRITHRKIETRVIVARPDTVEADGITPHPTALFGTYLWSDDEMTATLHDAPYRDGTPFADKTLEYVTDEVEYRDVLAGLAPGSEATFPARRAQALTAHPNLVRHYAVPGSVRCVQCHRGSPTADFILGMNPLQLARRPFPSGGTYEPTGEDELTQVQRFIDLGLITGLTSPADIVALEESQAPRHARTPEELTAQGYMIGNCVHCHNPRGYPSLVKPELSTALDLAPRAGSQGGIFELSLEAVSPLRRRGANGDVPVPYITPSLRDYPVAALDGFRIDNGKYLGSVSAGEEDVEVTWTPKYDPFLENYTEKRLIGCAVDPTSSYCRGRQVGRTFVAAPWRSLIYRNVDTPFPYFDDYVPFPHMPMNTAGFDCRAPRIMGDWMVSLPAERKNLRVSEDALPSDASKGHDGTFDDSPQPYREVQPGSAGYEAAVARAKSRLAEYHAGIRYNYCQDVLGPDIFDPVGTTTKVAKPLLPVPDRYLFGGIPPKDPQNPGYDAQPAIGVPYHAHWYNFDPTDDPPPWLPRRSQWQAILVDAQPDDGVVVGQEKVSPKDAASRALVRQALTEVAITDELVKYATTELPYGLWQAKPECQARFGAADVHHVSDFTASGSGTKVPAWIADSKADPAAPVFMASPGAMLYRHICFNCHGPKADGKGLQADLLSASSNGEARPANFVEGLFGPLTSPGQNLIDVFGGPAKDPAQARVWGSRYMAWMALGGTLQRIPTDIIHLVEATPILGRSRPNPDAVGHVGASANMLNLAKALCGVVLPDPSPQSLGYLNSGVDEFINLNPPESGYPPRSGQAPFVRENGDWEMWMNLCSRFTPQIIRVYSLRSHPGPANAEPIWNGHLKALYLADPGPDFVPFPDGAPVLDHDKQTQPFVRRVAGQPSGPDNFYPACAQRPGDLMSGELEASAPPPDKWAQFKAVSKLPDCPAEFLGGGRSLWRRDHVSGQDPTELDNASRWTLKGAAAAGMAVFSYLQAADLGHHKIAPYFNECQLLPPPK